MKTVIEMAREAGFAYNPNDYPNTIYRALEKHLERFAALVREDLQKEFDELQAMYIQQGLNYKRDMDERDKQQNHSEQDLNMVQPVAWMHVHNGEVVEFNDFKSCDECVPLYTKKEIKNEFEPEVHWRDLTEDEILGCLLKWRQGEYELQIASAVIAKFKEVNE